MPLTIAVLNLQSGIGTTKGYLDYISTAWKYLLPGNHNYILNAANVLDREKVDLAFLTEVNEISFRTKNQSHLNTLELNLTSMKSAFFPTIKTGEYIHEGSAVLSHYKIKEAHIHHLPSFLIPRVLGRSFVEIENTQVTVFVTHLSLAKRFRRKQIRTIADIIKNTPGPIILGGDFNERDISIFTPLQDVGLTPSYIKNFPSWEPRYSLDYLFLSNHFSSTSCYIPNTPAFSDHAPIIVKTIFTPQ